MATSIPPHNAAELCDAALHLIEKPDAQVEDAVEVGQGPGFPDRRHHRRFQGGHRRSLHDRAAARSASAPAGSRKRAARGTWVVVVTEIPWLVQKSRLIEKIAELLNEKKLPLVGDVRDESAEDIRLVIEPKSRTVDPALMMESLFRLTELESQHPAEPQRAGEGPHPEGAWACRVPARMARPSARRADPALQLPARSRSSIGWKCSAAS